MKNLSIGDRVELVWNGTNSEFYSKNGVNGPVPVVLVGTTHAFVELPSGKKIKVEEKEIRRKSEKICNRKACQKPGATWWNHSTQAWYCRRCAVGINRVNPEVPGLCEERPDGTIPERSPFDREKI